jgi:hypothetical protein
MIYNCIGLSIHIGQGVQMTEEVLDMFQFELSTMSWASKKHKSFSLSIVEAEYIAACDACTEVVWLRKMVYGLFDQVLDSIVIYCDNLSCVKLSENPVIHDRSKHIEIEYYFLHDRV